MTCGATIVSIVDDDQSFREALTGLVSAFGFRAMAFASAQAFLGSAVLTQAGCLISDVNMPGMGGLDLLRRLVDLGAPIPTILVTAAPDPAEQKAALAAGALDYLAKPLDSRKLLARINVALAPPIRAAAPDWVDPIQTT